MDAAQLQQVLGVVRPATRKATPFTSGDPVEWRAWRTGFEISARIADWDNLRQCREAKQAMQGNAFRYTDEVPFEAAAGADAILIADLLTALENRFLPPAAGRLARSQLTDARQKIGETANDWHARIRDLFNRAHPGGGHEANQDLIDKFCAGLVDKEIRTYTYDHHPATFAAALNEAQDKQATITVLAAVDAAYAATGDTQIGAMQPPNRFASKGPAARGPMNCWFCESPNHRRSECEMFSKALKLVDKARSGEGGRREGKDRVQAAYNISGRGRGGSGWRGRKPARGGGAGRGRGGYQGNRRIHQVDGAWAEEEEGAEEEGEEEIYFGDAGN